MRARALIDGKVTCNYEDGDSVLVDFQRAAGQTEVLTSGNYFGDSGVKAMDKFQSIFDTMNAAPFGGLPGIAEMGAAVWAQLRNDVGIIANLDKYRPVGGVNLERGVTVSGDRSKRYKVGDITIGGGSGQMVELWVNNETYEDDTGSQVRYLATNKMV